MKPYQPINPSILKIDAFVYSLLFIKIFFLKLVLWFSPPHIQSQLRPFTKPIALKKIQIKYLKLETPRSYVLASEEAESGDEERYRNIASESDDDKHDCLLNNSFACMLGQTTFVDAQ